MLVSQSEPRIEVFHRRAGGQWALMEFVGTDAICRFESLECEVPLSEIYRNITFDPTGGPEAFPPSAESA